MLEARQRPSIPQNVIAPTRGFVPGPAGGLPALYAKPMAPSDDKRWKIVETRMRRLGDRPAALIEALHAAQEAFGYLDDDALHYVGDTLGVPHSRVYGVATFYSYFTLKPAGEHSCVVCTGTACYINGAGEILAALNARLGVRPRETTTDGRLSLLTARCLGACSLAPAVIIDGDVKGKVGAADLVGQLEAM
jgi:bidirectional [NiFe] hydrogenase diaphorase subunit